MKLKFEHEFKLRNEVENCESHNIGNDRPILSYCLNRKMDRLAVIFGTEIIYIYTTVNRIDWILNAELVEHHARITGIDWNMHDANMLVSCGSDLNVYVWVCDDGDCWKPTFVLLRINRAATCVKWSPNGKRFAVGCSAQTVSICNYEKCDDLWVSRKIKRAGKGTITCLDWHSNSSIIAVGCIDGKLRVFEVSEHCIHGKFGDQLFEIEAFAWVHSLKFSSELSDHSFLLAYSVHNCSVGIISLRLVNNQWMFKLHSRKQYSCLPFTSMDFVLRDNQVFIIAAGYNCRFAEIDCGTCAMQWMSFENHTIDQRKSHENCITNLLAFDRNGKTMLSSSGLDGHIFVWELT